MNDDEPVVVIGSGPCGATAARQLVGRGVDVVMLDAGLHAPRGLLVRARGKTLWRTKGWADFAEHRHDTSSDEGVVWCSSLSLGGLSNFWTSAIPRYAAEDFTDGGRIDERYVWPVRYDDLVPYYDDLEKVMGLAAGDPIVGVPQGQVTLPVHLPKDWRSVAALAQARGHGVGAQPMARGPATMLVRRGTEFSSYHCMVAPLESSASFRLVTGAFVMRLGWSAAAGRVDTVDYADRRTGQRSELRARAVVLAAGAIDSPMVLLRSTSDDFPTGLGNSTDLVGRYLHDHPREWWVARLGRPMTTLDHAVYIARRTHEASDPLMATSLTLGLTRGVERVRTLYGGKSSGIGVQVLGTMVPSPERGLFCASLPGGRPSIHLRYDERAVSNMIDARRRITDVLGAGGLTARAVEPVHELSPGSSVHYGGAVRMHADPRFGVLDEWNRIHDAPNVVVADSSCFTTGPEKNPTLTSMALAARAADRLADDLGACTLPRRRGQNVA
jgi:choline dehydrogenase-like flavoprotein